MQIDIEKAHVFEIAKVGDRSRLQVMATQGQKLFVEPKPRTHVGSLLVTQQPHLGWNPPAEKASGTVWW